MVANLVKMIFTSSIIGYFSVFHGNGGFLCGLGCSVVL